MERVVARENAKEALKRVRRNKGSPGIDGMRVEELEPYLHEHWQAIREQLLTGSYRPSAVKRQLIPKSGGGERELGIPTVVQDGRRWVVDVGLEKFFDRVHHDVLMGKLHNRIADPRMLRIIRRYLKAGVLADGVVVERHEGTPQGGPLSPLLANVLLDEVDKELERRGHCFVRYADDCNVYVRSKRAGERVLAALRQMYAKLRLKVNEEKSTVARVWYRKFLGYSFWVAPGKKVKLRVAAKALMEMKQRVRQITSRSGGRSMERVTAELGAYLRGWKEYFKLSNTPGVFSDLDQWLHRRLRAVQLKQWKRGGTVYEALQRRGTPRRAARAAAAHTQRWWRLAGHGALHTALPGSYFDRLGVPRLAAHTSTH
jgi:RNA-directed DNA polymerase